MTKRIFDFIFVTIALILLSPVLFFIIIILRFTGEGEVFYLQKRPGLNFREFDLFKFATMTKNSSNFGAGDVTTKNDPRVLPFGKILRKTKLNEIPQLFNILKGDMSLVGPRPLPLKNFKIYTPEAQIIITKMTPGLTGVGSIVFRNEEEVIEKLGIPLEQCLKEVIMPYKANLEMWYYNNQSVLLYFKIILITAWVVIFPKSNIVKKLIPALPRNTYFESLLLSEKQQCKQVL